MSNIAVIQNLVKYYHTGDNVVKAVDHIDLEKKQSLIERIRFSN